MRKLLIITLLVVALSGCSLKKNIQSNTVNNDVENEKVVDLLTQPNVDDKLIDTKVGVKIKFSSDYQVNTDGSIDFGPKVKELILPEGMTEEAFKIAQSEAKQIFKYKFQSTNFRLADEILNGQGKLSISQGELIIINPWTVVKYSSVGAICDDTKLEVVGQNNNYIFSVNSTCSDLNTDQTSLNYLKEIISSMKFEANATSTLSIPLDWKTYSNNEYKFELKYPENLKVGEQKVSYDNKDAQSLVSLIDFMAPDLPIDGGNGFSVSVYKSKYSSLADFKTWYLYSHGGLDNINKITERKVGQLNFIDTDQADGVDSYGRYVYISNNGLVIEIVQSNRSGKLPSNEQRMVLDSVLSTFNFIK